MKFVLILFLLIVSACGKDSTVEGVGDSVFEPVPSLRSSPSESPSPDPSVEPSPTKPGLYCINKKDKRTCVVVHPDGSVSALGNSD